MTRARAVRIEARARAALARSPARIDDLTQAFRSARQHVGRIAGSAGRLELHTQTLDLVVVFHHGGSRLTWRTVKISSPSGMTRK